MPPRKRSDAYVWDMLHAARAVVTFAQNVTYEELLADEILQAAIERKVEIIGDAARNLGDAFHAQHPEIPWRAIIAQRHVIAHDYDELEYDAIWRVVTVHIPARIPMLERILPTPPAESKESE